MTTWIRFARDGITRYGRLEGETVHVQRGDPFGGAVDTGETVALAQIELLTPCVPGTYIALWNNFHAAAAKQGNAIPPEPLFFVKAANCYWPHGRAIRPPTSYEGRVLYEGELGVVIGREARDVDEAKAAECILGYTCVNDVTAIDILERDPSFPQWTRAKSFDTFGPFGPAIVSGLDPSDLVVRTLVNGRERQNYPVSDMIFPPAAIVSRLSREMTLRPGDLIACGTSIGAGPMRPGAVVDVTIDGVGTLSNPYQP
jgi:2-keto-4-pentenoate hydratase/2-oxohepta-3-ene-1,7-dioic acid hydratase in catechol pathway